MEHCEKIPVPFPFLSPRCLVLTLVWIEQGDLDGGLNPHKTGFLR